MDSDIKAGTISGKRKESSGGGSKIRGEIPGYRSKGRGKQIRKGSRRNIRAIVPLEQPA